jgi:hypothetical protein
MSEGDSEWNGEFHVGSKGEGRKVRGTQVEDHEG